jgi:uncharacterized protein YecA (UPF0149 family)
MQTSFKMTSREWRYINSAEGIAESRNLRQSREKQEPYRRPFNIKRNDPCPCGNGKKFKYCCKP